MDKDSNTEKFSTEVRKSAAVSTTWYVLLPDWLNKKLSDISVIYNHKYINYEYVCFEFPVSNSTKCRKVRKCMYKSIIIYSAFDSPNSMLTRCIPKSSFEEHRPLHSFFPHNLYSGLFTGNLSGY